MKACVIVWTHSQWRLAWLVDIILVSGISLHVPACEGKGLLVDWDYGYGCKLLVLIVLFMLSLGNLNLYTYIGKSEASRSEASVPASEH